MVEGKAYESLPANWSSFDLKSFSRQKQLWDYQRIAVQSAIAALWKYYEEFGEYQRGESLDMNAERKRRFFEWYQENELPAGMNLPLARLGRRLRRLLDDYYDTESPSPLPSPNQGRGGRKESPSPREAPHPNPLPASGARENGVQGRGGRGTAGEIPFESIVNRMCFWMATGSGKTLVLVKLIEVLRGLIRAGEIPPNDILVLTHREDLIEQLKRHVQEFNSSRNDLYIRLRELKEYAEAKRENPSLFGTREMTVFYYRSDNLSDEQKERIIDFRNYDDNGKWYVLLDEAHKGDKEDSKRQHIYSILARNGFLFNFSVTFTDERDIVTTVCDFNLARFTQAGYGKHLAILRQEFRAFRDQDDYTGEEKQKIVLKSLMLLAYVMKLAERLRTKQPKMYHRPLLLTLVNSVNTEDADLKRFFRELERAGKGEVADSVWQAAKKELLDELSQRPAPVFESDSVVSVQEDVLLRSNIHRFHRFTQISLGPGQETLQSS